MYWSFNDVALLLLIMSSYYARHCPFSHERCQHGASQRMFEKPRYIKNSRVRDDNRSTCRPPVVLFFSGGKDSFLSLALALKDSHTKVILLSTYDPAMGMNGIQQVPIFEIENFASMNELDLITVPISSNSLPYTDMVHLGLQLVPGGKVDALIFGDIHLEHIRRWREDEFSARLGYLCRFPLWRQDYSALIKLLRMACLEYKVNIVFCAIYDDDLREKLSPGMLYDDLAIQTIIESGKDMFGENGEFHTRVQLACSSV